MPAANPIQQFLATYEGWLAKKPILTKALTSAVGFALGDILAQCFLGGDAAFDWARFARVTSFGFVLHGTTGHVWYGKLDQLLPGTEAWKVAVKVAADQVLWAPIFTAMYFSYLGLAEGRSMDYIKAKIQNDTMAGVTASWKVWPIVHAVSFRFVPTELRILYINSIQVRWSGVTSGERVHAGGGELRVRDCVVLMQWGAAERLGLLGLRRITGACPRSPLTCPLAFLVIGGCLVFGLHAACPWPGLPSHLSFPILDLLQHLPVGAWQQERVGGSPLSAPHTFGLVARVRHASGLDRFFFHDLFLVASSSALVCSRTP